MKDYILFYFILLACVIGGTEGFADFVLSFFN